MRSSPLLLAGSLALLACSSSSTEPTPANVTSCPVPTPKLGTSPEAKALAAAPAHCGAEAHAWIDSTKLGDLAGEGFKDGFTASASQVALAAGNVVPKGQVHDVEIEQIAYVTQDRGKEITATALVAYPSDLEAREDLDVVLVLHGTAGFTDACAPSNGEDARPLVAAIASLGRVVVAPDYIGLRALGGPTGFLHPYLVAQPTAIASIDAVRASLRLLAKRGSTYKACARPRFATVGGSQGGHAALWVDRLAPYYAPELEHVGVVATVPPADMLGESARALSSEVPATGNLTAFFGAAADWYGARGRLSEVFNAPYDAEVPSVLGSSCDAGDFVEGKTLEGVFTTSIRDAAKSVDTLRAVSPWGCMLVESGLTTTSVKRLAPTAPSYGVLFVLGENDTLVDSATERVAFDALCAQGMSMSFLECAGASHTEATLFALPEILDFVDDRFAGKAVDAAATCKRSAPERCRGTR